MKTKILYTILLFVAIAGLSNSTYASVVKDADYTLLSEIKSVNNIEVRGNVELFITDSPTEQVKVYNKYYSENAFVQSKNGVLHITSYNPEKLIVWVSANDLRSVSAYDNAQVESFGKLSNIELNVDLHNNATAKLKLDVYNSNITLRDHANVELSGDATDFNINHSNGSVVINHDFSADHYQDTKISTTGEIESNVLTVLE
jgi:hypothetical protein